MAEVGGSESANPSRNPFARFKNFITRGIGRSPSETMGIHSPTTTSEDLQVQQEPFLQVEPADNQEILKPAQAIYFHTMPGIKLNSVRSSGLFGLSDTPTLSESLGYSLFLSYRDKYYQELKGRSPDGNDVRNRAPEDYVMTIWQDPNQHLAEQQDSYFARTKKFIITTETKPDELPQEFIEANQKSTPLGRLEPARPTQFSADNMIASIPLTKPVRETILRGMVLLHAGRLSANQIEQELIMVLGQAEQEKPGSVVLTAGALLEDLVHNVVASFAKELVGDIVLPVVNRVLKTPDVTQNRWRRSPEESPYVGESVRALFMATVYRKHINEPTLATQLDEAVAGLRQQLLVENVELAALDEAMDSNIKLLEQGQNQRPEFALVKIDDFQNYYSYTPTYHAAYSLFKELGIK